MNIWEVSRILLIQIILLQHSYTYFLVHMWCFSRDHTKEQNHWAMPLYEVMPNCLPSVYTNFILIAFPVRKTLKWCFCLQFFCKSSIMSTTVKLVFLKILLSACFPHLLNANFIQELTIATYCLHQQIQTILTYFWGYSHLWNICAKAHLCSIFSWMHLLFFLPWNFCSKNRPA